MNNCTECGNPCEKCGEVTPVCTHCADPVYTSTNCGETIDDRCVTYTGDNEPCLGITKPLSIKSVIAKIITYIKGILLRITSTSLKITRSGNPCNSSMTIEIQPSSDNGNAFTLGSDNYPFVPEVTIANGQCISFSKTTVNGKIVYTPYIDMDCLSALLCPLCSGVEPSECTAPGDLTINIIK